MLVVYPWQMEQWQYLWRAKAHDRLPHAMLLSGPDGIGLNHFAHCFAAALLCEKTSSDGASCGVCRGCQLKQAGNHPDLFLMEPDTKGKQIKVDQVRNLIEFITLKSHANGYKIAIFDPAEAMNRHAANTLLKTLEEPPPGSLMLLISHRPALLPITIRSRCQRLVFNGSTNTETVNWLGKQLGKTDVDPAVLLTLSGGVPLQAISLMANGSLEIRTGILADLEALQQKQADPVQVAKRWNDLGAAETFLWLTALIIDMLRLKLTGQTSRLTNQDIARHLQRLIKTLDLQHLVYCYDQAMGNWYQATGTISLNTQGLMEEMAIHWLGLGNRNGG